MRKNLKNFPGAAPPDPCRSSIGALTRTSLAPAAPRRAAWVRRGALRRFVPHESPAVHRSASRRTSSIKESKMQIIFGCMQKNIIDSHV